MSMNGIKSKKYEKNIYYYCLAGSYSIRFVQ